MKQEAKMLVLYRRGHICGKREGGRKGRGRGGEREGERDFFLPFLTSLSNCMGHKQVVNHNSETN